MNSVRRLALLAMVSALALPVVALAQTAGTFASHQQLSATGLNAAFGQKMDYSATPTFSGLTLSGLAGVVQCLHVNTFGTVSGTGSDCGSGGGGGTPGGSSGQIEYNNGGVFAGFTVSGDGTLNTSTGALAVTSSGGTAFGTGAFVNTGTSGATIPLLNGANTWSGVQTFNDSTLLLKGNTSGSLLIRCSTVCGSGTLILPAGSTNFSATGGTSQVVQQTSAGGALTVAQLACADISNAGTACTASTGTSGATVALLNGANTWSAAQTHTAKINSAASATGGAGLNVAPGVAPTSPVNGDVWTTSGGVFVRINGATQALGTVVSGTWTPTITYATPGNLSVAYTDQRGTYTKAGTICTAQFNVRFTPTFTTASGDLIIGGLPVARSQANSTTFEADGGNILPNYNFTGLGNVIVYTSTATSGLTTSQFNLESGVTDIKATNTTSGSAWWAAGSFTYAC